jgi:hypothetical protein
LVSKLGGGEILKFIAYWEGNPYDAEKIMKKTALNLEEAKKEPKKYPKAISANYNISGKKGFMLIEADNDEQLMNLALFFFPELTFEFVSIYELAKSASEWQKMKK